MSIRIVLILVLLTKQASHAQIELGFIGGINAASQNVSYGRSMRITTNGPYNFEVKSIKTYKAGIVINTRLGERVDFKTGLMYSGKGQYERLTRTDGSNGGFYFRDNINYMEIPISMVIDLGKQERNGIFFSTGFYFAQALSGKSHFYNYDIAYSFDPDVLITKTVDNWEPYTLYVKKSDIGLRNSIGYRLGHFAAELTNEIGLVNNIPYINNADPDLLSSISNENTRKNLVWSLNFTYLPFRIHTEKSDSDKTDAADNRITWHIGAGLTINTFSFSGDKNLTKSLADSYTNQLGYRLGIGINIPFNGRISLKPQMNLITRGGAYEDALGNGEVHEKLTYFSVPVLLSVGLGKFNVDLGPTVGFKLASRKTTDSGTTSYEFFDKPIDFGVSAGIGYSIAPKINMFAQYYLGIASVKDLLWVDQSNNKTEVDYRNRSFEIGITYRLK